MNKTQLIRTLSGIPISSKLLVEDQDVRDIIKAIKQKHKECAGQYDAIAKYFEAENLSDTFFDLWNFCKENLPYVEESVEEQYVSAPLTILKRGYSDCKCYALFIGGVLDAMKRKGYDLEWVYRFVPSQLFSTDIGHVFVVVNQVEGRKQNIWIDPVLNGFDQHFLYFTKRDEKISGLSRSGVVSGLSHAVMRRAIGSTAANKYFYTQGGQVFAYDQSVRPNGLTADQMGLPYAMELLSKGSGGGYDGRHPGTADLWWNNPPVTFWLNGRPYPLPPPNIVPGSQVPLMPLGLTARYASSFNGFSIPNGFMGPLVYPGQGPLYQNKLRMTPDLFPIDTQLSSNDSLPLILLEAAMGPLINSFSAYPYANAFGSTNNIDDKMFNHRNADDLLQPSISSTVLQTVAPELEFAAQALNAVVPGLGVAAGAGIKAAAGTSGGGTRSLVQTDAAGNPLQAGSLFTNADGSVNLIPWIVVGAVAAYFVIKE